MTPEQTVAGRWLTGLFRFAKYSPEFLQWVGTQRFRSPRSDERIQFQSLPPEEQAKIHARWQRSRKQEQPQGPGLTDTGQETWQGGKIYRGDVGQDTFVHFTPQSRARQILESQKLLANPPYEKFGIEGVQGISLGYGSSVPKTQTTHIDHSEEDPLVAVVFRTGTTPSEGYTEEVLWRGDVDLKDAKVVSAEEARKMLERAPQKITEDDMVVYGEREKQARVAHRWLREKRS